MAGPPAEVTWKRTTWNVDVPIGYGIPLGEDCELVDWAGWNLCLRHIHWDTMGYGHVANYGRCGSCRGLVSEGVLARARWFAGQLGLEIVGWTP